ncbi:Zn(II)2Cys6 transcription factor [Candidatus Bathyarchaeota archaeon]|nr:Zn(II)2Cys6 transcription factor [Candidatus Bathyarchaeota archaeon]
MANSAASSYTDSWCMGRHSREEVSTPWTEHGGLVPKVEVLDEEYDGLLESVPQVESAEFGEEHDFEMGEGESGADEHLGMSEDRAQKAKRPRGRPRKHPITPVVDAIKSAKGRSKTGCITCRKRKKKCDEAKPRCK